MNKLREYLKSKAQVKLFAMFRHATLKELEKAMKKARLKNTIAEYNIDAVVHFAAFSQVGA